MSLITPGQRLILAAPVWRCDCLYNHWVVWMPAVGISAQLLQLVTYQTTSQACPRRAGSHLFSWSAVAISKMASGYSGILHTNIFLKYQMARWRWPHARLNKALGTHLSHNESLNEAILSKKQPQEGICSIPLASMGINNCRSHILLYSIKLRTF